MTEFKPRAIQIVTIEDYTKIDYFEYKVDKQGIYRCPQDVFIKQDDVEVYHLLARKEQILQWAEVTTLVDVSLQGRLYGRKE